MIIDYTVEQQEFARQIAEVAQGVIQYIEAGATTGDAWNPVEGTPTTHTLIATASWIDKKFVNGTTILATDMQIMAAVFDVSPKMSGEITLNGKTLQLIDIKQIPAAGTPVAWRIICRD